MFYTPVKPARTCQQIFDTVVRRLHKQGAPCYKNALQGWDVKPCTINMKGHVSAVTSLLPTEKLTMLRRAVGYDLIQSLSIPQMRDIWVYNDKDNLYPRDPYIAAYRTQEFLEQEGINEEGLQFVIRLEEAHNDILQGMKYDHDVRNEEEIAIWFPSYLDIVFRRVAVSYRLNTSVLQFHRP